MLSAYLTGAGSQYAREYAKKKLLAGSGRRACQRRHARTGAAESPVSDNVVGAGLPAMRRLVATNA